MAHTLSRSSAFPPSEVSQILLQIGDPCASLPAFAWGDVETPIRIITMRHSLLALSLPAFPSAFLAVSFPLRGEYGLTSFRVIHLCPRWDNGQVRLRCSAGGFDVRVTLTCPKVNQPHTILVQACQQLWPVVRDDV